MKKIIYSSLFIFFLTNNLFSQDDKIILLADDIVKTLESTKAIQNLIINKKKVEGQLADINSWASSNKITPETYSILKSSYNAYSLSMNNVADNLKADLRSINSLRKLKPNKFAKFIKKYSERYADDLNNANKNYTTSFLPAFESASIESGAKPGFIGTIIFLIKHGESIYKAIKSIFTGDKISKETEEELISLAIDFSIKKIDKKLRYKEWDLLVLTETDGSKVENEGFVPNDNVNEIIDDLENTKIEEAGSYSVIDGVFEILDSNGNPFSLESISKGISVNNSRKVHIPTFKISKKLKVKDEFQLSIRGYEFAQFFYYNSEINKWEAIQNKGIGVTAKSDLKGKKLILPSENESYIIDNTGDRNYEEIFILISNSQIKNNIINQLSVKSISGNVFLDFVKTKLKKIKNYEEVSTFNDGDTKILLNNSEIGKFFIPIHILIDKK